MSIKEQFLQGCPNSLFEHWPFQTALANNPPTPKLRRMDRNDLPLLKEVGVVTIGTGDWGNSRSSEGSIVLGCGKYVVKIPLGQYDRDPHAHAKKHAEMIEFFKEVSPPTTVIIARVDHDGTPRPVIIQEKINGKPACKTNFADLLHIHTLEDMKQILKKMRGMHQARRLIDLCGQQFSSRTWARIFDRLPFFSSNIMVQFGGGAVLTDNTFDPITHYRGESRTKEIIDTAKFIAVETLIDFLIVLQKRRNLLGRLKRETLKTDPTDDVNHISQINSPS